MKLTDEQTEVQDAVATLPKGDNLKVIAFAGAGKTTTLTACAEALKVPGVYLAFNRGVADEAFQRFRHTKCKPMTIHKLALGVMKDCMANQQVANIGTWSFKKYRSSSSTRYDIPTIQGWDDERISAAVIRTITAYSASEDPLPNPEHAKDALISAMGDPDFMLPGRKTDLVRYTIERLADPISQMAQNYYMHCMQNGFLNHDMYLKMLDVNEDMRNAAFKHYRYIMIDEAQDINPVQRSILQKTGLPLVAVGDPYQQIYSWRGAENSLMEFPGREIYLTKSFRFGPDIATIARCILDSIPDNGGPTQRLVGTGPEPIDKDAPEKIAIICRTNFGMLDEALNLFRQNNQREDGKNRIFVDNIDNILAGALSARALYENRMEDVVAPDLKEFNSWDELETTAEDGSDPGLSRMVRLVRREMIDDVQTLFNYQQNQQNQGDVFKNRNVVICTAHRAKGLEYDRVKLSEDFRTIDDMNRKYRNAKRKSAKHITLAKEAYNTLYVAATRAKLQCSGHSPIFNLSSRNVRPSDPATQEEIARAYGSWRRSNNGEYGTEAEAGTGNGTEVGTGTGWNTENNGNDGNDGDYANDESEYRTYEPS